MRPLIVTGAAHVPSMNISVLDIGATTINLLRASVGSGGLKRHAESQRFVRLGEGTLLTGFIDDESWNSALDGIDDLLGRAREHAPDRLVAVATSVVREASNGPALRKHLQERHRLPVRVLSSHEEARLVLRGALSTMLPGDQRVVAVDIGGGCINFAVGQRNGCQHTSSLPLGALRLSPAFAPAGTLGRHDAEALASLIARALAPLAVRLAEGGDFQLVFSAGAARAVREHAMRFSEFPGVTGTLDLDSARRVRRDSVACRPADLVARGVGAERAPTFAISASLVGTIMETLGAASALVVDRGLREGVALDEHDRDRLEAGGGGAAIAAAEAMAERPGA